MYCILQVNVSVWHSRFCYRRDLWRFEVKFRLTSFIYKWMYIYIYIYQRLWTLKILQIEAVICSNANSVPSGPQVTYFSVFVPKYEITVSAKCIKRPSIKIDHFVPVLMYSIHNACRYKSDGTMYSSWLCLLWPSGHAEQTAAKFEWNYSNPYVINTWKCCDAHADHYGIGCCFLLKLEYYSKWTISQLDIFILWSFYLTKFMIIVNFCIVVTWRSNLRRGNQRFIRYELE